MLYVYISIYIHTDSYISACIHTYSTHACTHTCMCMSVIGISLYVCMHTCVCISLICVYVCNVYKCYPCICFHILGIDGNIFISYLIKVAVTINHITNLARTQWFVKPVLETFVLCNVKVQHMLWKIIKFNFRQFNLWIVIYVLQHM